LFTEKFSSDADGFQGGRQFTKGAHYFTELGRKNLRERIAAKAHAGKSAAAMCSGWRKKEATADLIDPQMTTEERSLFLTPRRSGFILRFLETQDLFVGVRSPGCKNEATHDGKKLFANWEEF
jgi:hypothetical protein